MITYQPISERDEIPFNEEVVLVFEGRNNYHYRIGMKMQSPSGREVLGVIGDKTPSGDCIAFGILNKFGATQ